jgi:MFS family permease
LKEFILAAPTKFSGWSILISCFAIMFFVQGGIQNWAIIMPAIIRETGFSLGEVALVSSIATAVAFISNMLFAPLLKKISARTILIIGAFCAAGHFVGYSFSHSLTEFYASAVLGGFGIGFGTVAPVSVIMTNWFVDKRATFMSIVIAGSMFGGAVLMPLSGQLIHAFDWRIACRIIAVLMCAIPVLTLIFVVADDPKTKGKCAYGAEKAYHPKQNTPDHAGQNPVLVTSDLPDGISAKEARRSYAFWLLLPGILLLSCATNIENFLPAFWQSSGLSVETSSSIMGIYAFITGIWTMVMGRIADKLGGKVYSIFTSGLFIIGTVSIFLMGAAAMPLMIMALIPFAAGAKKTATLMPPLIVAEAFGRRYYGEIIGNYTAMLQLGIAISNPVVGLLHKLSGGYQLPFMSMACLSGIALILILVSLKLTPYRKNKAIAG